MVINDNKESVTCRICGDCINMMTRKKEKSLDDKIVKSTKEGRLYIKTSDFFKQVKVKQTVDVLLNSDLVKNIEIRRIEVSKRIKTHF